MESVKVLDVKICGGLVIDGSGAPGRIQDVGIRGEQIEVLGDLETAEAKVVIDARGLIVAPGFIDAHSHSDVFLLIEPAAPNKIFQGVTTEVVGNCGVSAAPLVGDYRLPSDWRDKPLPGQWRTLAEYRRVLEAQRPAPNVLFLVGHNTLRSGVMGPSDRPATELELRKMKRLLRQTLEEGACGLSTGLVYPPGMFADRREFTELAATVARVRGIYASHMRSEGAQLLDALKETISVGRSAGVRVQISHLKTAGRAHWGLLDDALELIRKARSGGVEVAADSYPYTCSWTDLDVIFPRWAHDGGAAATLARLKNPAERERLRKELLATRADEDWQAVIIASTRHPDNRRFHGRPLVEVAAELGLEPVDAVLHLAETDALKTSAFFFGMCEANLRRILAEPYVMIGSDASVRALDGPLSQDYPHPRAFGTFPRFLRMVLEGKLSITIEEAVRKMTGLPAVHFRLKDRGVLARTMKADVVIFDPSAIRDTATYEEPRQLATGVRAVLVNGVLTMLDGKLTGQRGGRFLEI